MNYYSSTKPRNNWSNTLLRVVFIPLGLIMLIFGLVDVLSPRAKYASSEPGIGASLTSLPTSVTVGFGAELDPNSEISVYATGVDVATDKISSKAVFDPKDPQRRSLTVSLRPMQRQGTYRVDWHTKANGGSEAYGNYYFAVGMPVPSYLKFFEDDVRYVDDAAPNSTNPALVGGVLLIAIGLFAPMFRSVA